MKRTWLPTLLLGFSCAPSEGQFQNQLIDRTCELYLECMDGMEEGSLAFESADECAAYMELYTVPEVGDDCEYHADVADGCLDALDAAQCSDLEGEIAECDGVYTGNCSRAAAGD